MCIESIVSAQRAYFAKGETLSFFKDSDFLLGKNIDLNATGNSIAPLIIRGGTGGYMEGIRILGTGGATGWADIVLGGATNSGIDANQWFIGVNNQSFYLTHAGSSSSSTGFFSSDTSGNWLIQNTLGIGGRNTSYKLYIGGSTYIAGNITTGTAGASIHHVNGTYTSNIGLLYANGGIEIREAGLCTTTQSALNYGPTLGFHWGGRVAHSLTLGSDGVLYHYNNGGALATFKAGAIYGAVWNDYAEYRLAESIEPGRCIIEHKSGEMKLSTERLQPGAEIISDTFGFAIGESEESKTPIAAAGRVLAYPNEDRYSYPLGCAVCSGPNGTVSQMTREEIREYPERIIGTVSEIPEYETWGAGNVPVNGRIWIRIK